MTPAELNHHRILIVGAGVTGRSVMRYLVKHQLAFDVADEKARASDEYAELSAAGAYIAGLHLVDVGQYSVMVLSPGIPRAQPMIASAIQAGVKVIGDVELFASVVDGDVIAITGSNGKSTVASMAAHVLKTSRRSVKLCGNIGTAVLDVLPDTADGSAGFGANADASANASASAGASATDQLPVYVLELSSYQLESLSRLTPLAATVLNISDDHLDRYDSIDHYAATKRGIYQHATHCVVNADDARTYPDSNSQSLNSTAWFSLQQDSSARFKVKMIEGKLGLCIDDTCVLMADELSVPGSHNVANALAVMALLQPLNLELADLKAGLVTFRGLAHRTELVMERDGVRWFNDSKGTNVDACIKAIQAMPPGSVILIAGGQGKGVDFTPLHPVVSKSVKALILLGEDTPLLRVALTGAADIHEVDNLPAAVMLAKTMAVSGDVVLLSPACASFDMFDNYMARGDVFRESVEQLAA